MASKFLYVPFLSLFIFVVNNFLFTKAVYAQVPPPPVPCDEIRPNLLNPFTKEYHSLRPYQASVTCETYATSFATFCGNDLTINDTILVNYPFTPGGKCSIVGLNIICDYTVKVNKTINIDLSGVDLPIMGNTGDEGEVINYTNTKDELTDADKMNSYVSWYLEGVVNKKEYPDKTDSESMVNYSGPVSKLAPKQIQENRRVETVENALGKSLSSGREDVEQNRHNQVVVCTKWDPIQGTYPVDCQKLIDKDWRLEDWSGNFAFATVEGWVVKSFANMIPKWLKIGEAEIREMIKAGAPWNHKYPPLPWSPEIMEDKSGLNKNMLYKKAYSEWQGNFCLIVPLIKTLFCVNNPFVPDRFAELFHYIPMSSTEDIEGEIMIDQVSSGAGSGDAIISDVEFKTEETAKLNLSHMEESDQLASLLQATFVPMDQDKVGSPTNIDVSEATCNTLQVRSNPGDDMFATGIVGDLSYTAKFTCKFGLLGTQWCTKNVAIGLSTQSKIPLIDDVWSRLVAGPMSIVKRIFPKTNSLGSLGLMKDFPGSTNINYTSTDVSITQSSTDLKIPHLGGIQEYFLNGIQTALRPKGYGNYITFGDYAPEDVPEGVCDGEVFKKYNPPSQTTGAANSYFFSYIYPKLSEYLLAVYKEAERKTGVPCEVLAGIHFREGSNNPTSNLMNGGSLNGKTLLASAIEAAEHLKAKTGGSIGSWNDLMLALDYYNGPGNENCVGHGGYPKPDYTGPCPPPTGIDHNYVMNLIDPKHLVMYIIYCRDYTVCYPYQVDSRPGALTVATELYNNTK